jgi:hypothetical protein
MASLIAVSFKISSGTLFKARGGLRRGAAGIHQRAAAIELYTNA